MKSEVESRQERVRRLEKTSKSKSATKEGPYQDRPLLCPFRLSPLLTCSGSTIAFLKILKNPGSKSKNIEKKNPPSTLNSNQIPQIQQ